MKGQFEKLDGGKDEIEKLYMPRRIIGDREIAKELKELLFRALSENSFDQYEDDVRYLHILLEHCIANNNLTFLDSRIIRDIASRASESFYEKYLPLSTIFQFKPMMHPYDSKIIMEQWLANPTSPNMMSLEFLKLANYGDNKTNLRQLIDFQRAQKLLTLAQREAALDKLLVIWTLTKISERKFTVNDFSLFMIQALDDIYVGRGISAGEIEGFQANYSEQLSELKDTQKIALGRYLLDLAINANEYSELLPLVGLHKLLFTKLTTLASVKSTQDASDILRLMQSHTFDFNFYIKEALPAVLLEAKMFDAKLVLDRSISQLQIQRKSSHNGKEIDEDDLAKTKKSYFGGLDLTNNRINLVYSSCNPIEYPQRSTKIAYMVLNGRAVIDRSLINKLGKTHDHDEICQIVQKLDKARLLQSVKRSLRPREPRQNQSGPRRTGERSGGSQGGRGQMARSFSAVNDDPWENQADEGMTPLDKVVHRGHAKEELKEKAVKIQGLNEILVLIKTCNKNEIDKTVEAFQEFITQNKGREIEAMDSLCTSLANHERQVLAISMILSEVFKPSATSTSLDRLPELEGSYNTASGIVSMDYNKYQVAVNIA